MGSVDALQVRIRFILQEDMARMAKEGALPWEEVKNMKQCYEHLRTKTGPSDPTGPYRK